MGDLERQISWVTRASSTRTEERRADYAQLLRQVPQVSQLSLVSAQGREQLRIDMHDGVPVQAPEADLLGQEAAPPSFRRASGLPSGSVLFSELRLSTRQGSAGQRLIVHH